MESARTAQSVDLMAVVSARLAEKIAFVRSLHPQNANPQFAMLRNTLGLADPLGPVYDTPA